MACRLLIRLLDRFGCLNRYYRLLSLCDLTLGSIANWSFVDLLALLTLIRVVHVSSTHDVHEVFVSVLQIDLEHEKNRITAQVAKREVLLQNVLATLVAYASVAAIHGHSVRDILEANAALHLL